MEYVGIACVTVLIRTSLHALEINFSFHPITFLVIFSCKSLNVFTLDFPLAIGNTRYFSQSSNIYFGPHHIPYVVFYICSCFYAKE